MTSWVLQQGGARGFVLDAHIRYWLGLEVRPNFTPCARHVAYRIGKLVADYRDERDYRDAGHLGQPRAGKTGDWVIAEVDGVVVMP